ncbi:MAG: glucose-1-phosphate cytidylyltransferase [Lachnospiraceae bacterium]|nr:glucose-1-phosphate cytidylyltransferase [Lachnospiraceae bacterium]
MKVVILAGGKGTRISEESRLRPKPMVEIGGKPILWHIMRQYASFGFQEFIVCCGYKGHMIKEYFVNYYQNSSQIEISLKNQHVNILEKNSEPWKVTLVDTGLETLTAGRILRVREYIGDGPFLLTYGDGVSNVDLHRLLQFHQEQGKMVTISTTQPEGRFGALRLDDTGKQILGFQEKAREDQAWINIGFMVMEPSVYPYLGDGSTMLEREPFEQLAADGQLAAYKHTGFWSPMDNIHDREYLEKLWNAGEAPWRVG